MLVYVPKPASRFLFRVCLRKLKALCHPHLRLHYPEVLVQRHHHHCRFVYIVLTGCNGVYQMEGKCVNLLTQVLFASSDTPPH
jgi:hypothetical protein